MCDAFHNLEIKYACEYLVDSKIHDNKSMLFFIETGKYMVYIIQK